MKAYLEGVTDLCIDADGLTGPSYLNEDFLQPYLAVTGQLAHQVVYYPPEDTGHGWRRS